MEMMEVLRKQSILDIEAQAREGMGKMDDRSVYINPACHPTENCFTSLQFLNREDSTILSAFCTECGKVCGTFGAEHICQTLQDLVSSYSQVKVETDRGNLVIYTSDDFELLKVEVKV